MKPTITLLCLSTFILSCQTTSINQAINNNEPVPPTTTIAGSESINKTDPASTPEYTCPGNTDLPEHLSAHFIPVEDSKLLNSVLGQPEKGALCQGKVYESISDRTLNVYRAWNSTNPNSEMGTWWAGEKPAGLTAQYRTDYEICYQWSPLDKMTQCTLKAGSKVVIGTGQSAMCSDYLTYPASPEKQIFIQNASDVLEDCEQFDAIFDWQSI